MTRRAGELGIRHVFQGIADKRRRARCIVARTRLGPDALACVGDDTPDVPMLERADARRGRGRCARDGACGRALDHAVGRWPRRREGSMRSVADRTRHLIQRGLTMVAIVAGGALLFNVLGRRRRRRNDRRRRPRDDRGYYLTEATTDRNGRGRTATGGGAAQHDRAAAVRRQRVRLAQLELDYTHRATRVNGT